jgi:alpha-mannosidase
MPGLADHLAAPPAAYAHLPYDASLVPPAETLISLRPSSVQLLACKRSWDGEALVVRLQEAVGKKTKAELEVTRPTGQERGLVRRGADSEERPSESRPSARSRDSAEYLEKTGRCLTIPLAFGPFEIKTLRVEPDGACRDVPLVEEK